MSNKILVVVHQETSSWGKIGEFLLARGYELDRCCPCTGDELPANLDRHEACVIFGGPQSANDDDNPGIRAELDWLEACALGAHKPLLGICLGAQQIARVLGASVGPCPRGTVEIGYCQVHPTTAGERFLTAPTTFYQWHSETFTIPADAVHLAENDAFAGQAFRYRDNVYAIEFHPEMTRDMVHRWSTSEAGSKKLSRSGAQGHIEQMAGYDRFAAGSDAWLAGFIDETFLSGNQARQGADVPATEGVQTHAGAGLEKALGGTRSDLAEAAE